MKKIFTAAIALMMLGSLTSCLVYPDNYSGNEQYYNPYYYNGYYYAPDVYYGNGGYYGNDGYYYRNGFQYYYDNGYPFYYGTNNRRIYLQRPANPNRGDGGFRNPDRYYPNNSADRTNNSNSNRGQIDTSGRIPAKQNDYRRNPSGSNSSSPLPQQRTNTQNERTGNSNSGGGFRTPATQNNGTSSNRSSQSNETQTVNPNRSAGGR